jgi:hypothetical protein
MVGHSGHTRTERILCGNSFEEGVTQGDPLAMFAYGIGGLPLIRRLKRNHLELFQPWYADNTGASGKFEYIRAMFEELQKIGPA